MRKLRPAPHITSNPIIGLAISSVLVLMSANMAVSAEEGEANEPTIASPAFSPEFAQEPLWIEHDGLLVAQIGKSNSWAAYSKHSGKWRTHKFPKDTAVIPIIGSTVVVFQITGKDIRQLVAVDKQGRWRTTRLANPATKCIPVVGSNVAAVQIGDRIHAFSGLNGAWDATQHAGSPRIDNDTVMTLSRNRISVFSAFSGHWAESPSLAPRESDTATAD